jgi:hypothetical protein
MKLLKIRKWAEFKADFPDDLIEDENDIIQFGGKGVTEAIGEILRALGCKVSGPHDRQEHGWTLDVGLEKWKFWCQVSSLEDFFYMVLDARSDPFFNRQRMVATYVRILNYLDAELRRDPRFRDIVWRTQEEMPDGPGAPHPVEEQ